MNLKKLLIILVIAFTATLVMSRPGQSINSVQAPRPTLTPTPVAEKLAIEAALRSAAQSDQKIIPAFLVYQVTADRIELSSDGKTALVWMGLIDPQTNQLVATEPGLAIARRADQNLPWQITLPTGQNYLETVLGVPDSLLTTQEKSQFKPAAAPDTTVGQVFTGYLLPWEGGKRAWLTGSVAHFTTYNSCSWVTVNGDNHSTCRYAFDFADGTNFRILASKGGAVVGSRWSCVNNDHNCLNYIALEDTSTTPVTTAIYLHLAQESIPAALRVNGTYVNQGDFIALADNTGLSTGSHLHFMVVGNRWWGTAYGGFWWGDSVDITFSEVDVNGGRPRLCSEAYYSPQYGNQCIHKDDLISQPMDNWYISANRGGAAPPTAVMTGPAAYSTLTTSTVTVTGSATGRKGVSFTRVAANTKNSWVEIGPKITDNPFTTSIDLCAAGIPNGPVTLGLYSYDMDGNRSAIIQDPRPVSFNATCTPPPPKCMPAPDQISIYSLPDYQGECQVFGVGKYDAAQFTPVGNNQAASLQVGANVMAVLYDGNYESGFLKDRSEAFLTSDPGLADNRIGVKASSLEVMTRVKPTAPLLRTVLNTVDSTQKPVPLNSNESVLLVWKGADSTFPPDDGGSEYQAELTYPNGTKRTSEWQEANSWSVGSLAAGVYTWTVTARNLMGEAAAAPATFTVAAAAPPAESMANFPYNEGFESGAIGWSATGLWHRAASPDSARNSPWAMGFNNGTIIANDQVAGGGLTSPSFVIPAGGAILKFHYYSFTEDSLAYWDQRRVQISASGGPFQDVLQLWDDPVGEWQDGPAISLVPYAGMPIRVRFYFHSVDKYNNGFSGWWIDDVSVTENVPNPSCTEIAPNNTPAQATLIDLNQSVSGFICPAGDLDFYKFTAPAGTTLTADVIARAEGSSLDPYLYLLDGDGKSILAENDDIQYGILQDSHIGYTLQRSGTYYLKVKAYKHPGVGGINNPYRLELKGIAKTPLTLPVINPISSWVGPGNFDWAVSTAGIFGVTHVDFYWHSPEWRVGTWELLGSVTNLANPQPEKGWKVNVSPFGRTIEGSAVLARAYNSIGEVASAVVWNLHTDTDIVPPVSALIPQPALTLSTAVTLAWTASDSASGINSFELQYQEGAGVWTPIDNLLPRTATQAFFQGTSGQTYGFRLRAIDRANNKEDFSATAQVTTTLASSCTPDEYDATAPGDNAPAGAVTLVFKKPQSHNFCYLGQGGLQPQAPFGDEDWYRIAVKAGDKYMLSVNSISGGAAAAVAIMDAAGTQTLAQGTSFGLGQAALVTFTSPANAEYLVRVRPLDASLWGTDTRYSIILDQANLNQGPNQYLYLPRINR